MISAISRSSHSSCPAARAASRLSITDPARPFMNTERRSFSSAASPARSETTSTGIPSGPISSANAFAPPPDASAGVPIPRTGPSSPMSAKRAPEPSTRAASSRFKAGEAVFMSA